MRPGVAALVLLGLSACEHGDTPVRPQLDQVVIAGELALDATFDDRIRDGKPVLEEARRPLIELYDVLKGSDLFRERSATFVPLGAGFRQGDCGEPPCPGRAELALVVRQAGIDAVSLADPDIGAARANTEALLGSHGVCTAVESDPCVLTLGATRVAFLGLAGGEGLPTRARAQIEAARESADVVILSIAAAREHEASALEGLGADVVLLHGTGHTGGVEVHGRTLLIDDPGSLVERKPGKSKVNFLYRVHLQPDGLVWAEGIPFRLLNGRSRPAWLDEAASAVDDLLDRSEAPDGVLSVEHGRLIADLLPPPTPDR